MQQQTFWPEYESKYAEEQALLIGAVATLAKRKHIAEELVELLRYLHNCDREEIGARTYLDTMADRLGLAERTLQARLKVLREAGFLRFWRTPRGKAVNQVDWQAIRSAAFASPPKTNRQEEHAESKNTEKTPSRHFGATPRRTGVTSRNSCATPRRSGATNRYVSSVSNLSTDPHQQQQQAVATAEPAERTDWQPLLSALAAIGCFSASKTLAICRQAGVSPSEVEQVLAYWQVHAGDWKHDLKVLVLRLRESFPGQPVEVGWPPRTSISGPSDEAERESRAYRIIKAGRSQGATDERIEQVLAHHGLTWP